jgi:hypothetical protein
LLIAASICRSRNRRRQIPIKAIQCCTMLMIFVLRLGSQQSSVSRLPSVGRSL